MHADTVIIGSGISGLTAAALLAKNNIKIVLVEEKGRPGGALKRFKRKGVPFDVGFHYTGCCGDGQILKTLWNYIGLADMLEIVPFPKNGCDSVKIQGRDREVHCYFAYDDLENELVSNFPQEKQGIIEFLNLIKNTCSKIPFYSMDLELSPFLKNFFNQGKSVQQIIASLIKDPELQAVLAAPAVLYGVKPQVAGLLVHASVVHGYHTGAYGIVGGGQAVVDAFLKLFETLDVEVLTNAKAQEIIVQNGEVQGVETAAGFIHSKKVIYTGPPLRLLDSISPEVFRPAYVHRLQDLKNTASMFIVFGVTEDFEFARELQWQNRISLSPGFDVLKVHDSSPVKNSLLMTAPGLRDSRNILPDIPYSVILMRPAAWSEVALFADSRLRNRPAAYEEWKEKNCQALLNLAHHELGLDTGRFSVLESGSPLTFRDELGMPEGGIYGPQFCLGQYNPAARTRVDGLLLGGQATLMPGIVGASLSAIVTCGEIAGLNFLWDEIRKCR